MKVMDAAAILFSFKIALCGGRRGEGHFLPGGGPPSKEERKRGRGEKKKKPSFLPTEGIGGRRQWLERGGRDVCRRRPFPPILLTRAEKPEITSRRFTKFSKRLFKRKLKSLKKTFG